MKVVFILRIFYCGLFILNVNHILYRLCGGKHKQIMTELAGGVCYFRLVVVFAWGPSVSCAYFKNLTAEAKRLYFLEFTYRGLTTLPVLLVENKKKKTVLQGNSKPSEGIMAASSGLPVQLAWSIYLRTTSTYKSLNGFIYFVNGKASAVNTSLPQAPKIPAELPRSGRKAGNWF